MNKAEIVEDMIAYIEQAEKDLQASKISSDSKASKNDIINGILDRLEMAIDDEN